MLEQFKLSPPKVVQRKEPTAAIREDSLDLRSDASPSKEHMKRQLAGARKQVKQLLKENKEKDEKIEEQRKRINELVNEVQELREIVPTDEEQDALDCLDVGNLDGALEMFHRASEKLEQKLSEREQQGTKLQMDALQEHLEIQYGIDGMTQNSFQRMVAIIGRHTAVESEAIAARQKERSKPRGTYKPRVLSNEKNRAPDRHC